MTKQKAIEGCKRQDRIAQKYLFDQYSDAMLMVCLRYVKDLADAEELMLNGFFSFYKAIERFVYSEEQSIGAWLKKIMVNECLMHLRKKGRLVLVEQDYAADVAVEETQTERLNASELFKTIMTLPEGYRVIFSLYVIEGYSHKEIAAMTGITEGTSKSQLSKARAMLQKKITVQ